MWLLGIELMTSGRAVSALNHWAISPALECPLCPRLSPTCLTVNSYLGFRQKFLCKHPYSKWPFPPQRFCISHLSIPPSVYLPWGCEWGVSLLKSQNFPITQWLFDLKHWPSSPHLQYLDQEFQGPIMAAQAQFPVLWLSIASHHFKFRGCEPVSILTLYGLHRYPCKTTIG